MIIATRYPEYTHHPHLLNLTCLATPISISNSSKNTTTKSLTQIKYFLGTVLPPPFPSMLCLRTDRPILSCSSCFPPNWQTSSSRKMFYLLSESTFSTLFPFFLLELDYPFAFAPIFFGDYFAASSLPKG